MDEDRLRFLDVIEPQLRYANLKILGAFADIDFPVYHKLWTSLYFLIFLSLVIMVAPYSLGDPSFS
jgi:hypothetical protein